MALGRHEIDRVGRANLLAGQVWEEGLQQPENALLRYREAASLLPGEPEPLFRAARVADALGRVQEAVAGYQQAIELAGPAPASDTARTAAHQSHHALARLFKSKLGEPQRAKEHLEAAFALDPKDLSALDELLPYFRATGRAAELADACEKGANAAEEPRRRPRSGPRPASSTAAGSTSPTAPRSCCCSPPRPTRATAPRWRGCSRSPRRAATAACSAAASRRSPS